MVVGLCALALVAWMWVLGLRWKEGVGTRIGITLAHIIPINQRPPPHPSLSHYTNQTAAPQPVAQMEGQWWATHGYNLVYDCYLCQRLVRSQRPYT